MSTRSKYSVDHHIMVIYPEGLRDGIYAFAQFDLTTLPDISTFDEMPTDTAVEVEEHNWMEHVWHLPESRQHHNVMISDLRARVTRTTAHMLESAGLDPDAVDLCYYLTYAVFGTPASLQVDVVPKGDGLPANHVLSPTSALHRTTTHVSDTGVTYTVRRDDTYVVRGPSAAGPRKQMSVITIQAPVLLALGLRNALMETNGVKFDGLTSLVEYFRPTPRSSRLLLNDFTALMATCREVAEREKQRLIIVEGVSSKDIATSISVHLGEGELLNVPEIQIYLYREPASRSTLELEDGQARGAKRQHVRENLKHAGVSYRATRVPHEIANSSGSGLVAVLAFSTTILDRNATPSAIRPIYGRDGLVAYDNLNDLHEDWVATYAVTYADKVQVKKYLDLVKNSIYEEMEKELKWLPPAMEHRDIWADISVTYTQASNPHAVIVALRALDPSSSNMLSTTSVSTAVSRAKADRHVSKPKRTTSDVTVRVDKDVDHQLARTTVIYDLTDINNLPASTEPESANPFISKATADDLYRRGILGKAMCGEGTARDVMEDEEFYRAIVASASEVHRSAISYVAPGRLLDVVTKVTFDSNRRPKYIEVAMLYEREGCGVSNTDPNRSES